MSLKEKEMLKLLERSVFEMIVETKVELYHTGLYDDPELPDEGIPSTEEMDMSLSALEAYERVMRILLDLDGLYSPKNQLDMALISHAAMERVVDSPDVTPLPPKTEQWMQDFVKEFIQKQEERTRKINALLKKQGVNCSH